MAPLVHGRGGTETGGTMVIVTHDIDLTRLVSDHVSVLWRGKIVKFLTGKTQGPLGMDA